jgi:hypothetical protein
MSFGTVLTQADVLVIMKHLADWARTISAGAILLGLLNPDLIGEDAAQAITKVGLPFLVLCFIFSVLGGRIEKKKR